MNYMEIYKEKLTTADAIAKMIKPGMYIQSDIGLSAPPAILKAIDKRAKNGDIKDVKMRNSLLLFPLSCYSEPESAEKIRGISMFSDAVARNGVNHGITDVFPFYYRDGMDLIENYLKLDVFVAVVSPMDKHGYFSFGASTSCITSMISKAKKVFLEVNEFMPRAVNAPQIHVSQVTAICLNTVPLVEISKSEIDDKSLMIGNLIANEIPNGATLQLGIGAIPDAVGKCLKNKSHLGIHTEMLTDSMIELIECGAVDNSMKPINKGCTVTTFAFGSKRIYDYIDDNPTVKILPVKEVNDPNVIAQHPNFISINSALEVDFWGQVCAESIGTYHVSGTGGQVDFVRGAVLSEGGKSFIAFTSTAKNDTISRIKPTLTPGNVVTTSKNDVDYIVTEYGMAQMRGKTLSERTKALISIAHPKFREELTYQAKEQNIII